MDFKRTVFLTMIFLTMNVCMETICAQEIPVQEAEAIFETELNSAKEIGNAEPILEAAPNNEFDFETEPKNEAREISETERSAQEAETHSELNSASSEEAVSLEANPETEPLSESALESENEISAQEDVAKAAERENEPALEEAIPPEEIPEENSAAAGAAFAEFEKNYHLEKDSRQKAKFVQRLSWQKIPNVEKYEIEIQKYFDESSGKTNAASKKNPGSGYRTIFKETVSDYFVEVSLEAGNYRFRVSAANLLDRERKSEWKRFTVLKALMPKIQSVRPKKIYVNSAEKNDGIFSLHGENFLEYTFFSLLAVDADGTEREIALGRIVDVSPDGKDARVQFDPEKIQEGSYKIAANNPGDFSDVSETVSAKMKFLSFETVQLGAAYFLPIFLYDGSLENYMDSKITLLNVSADISLLFLVKDKAHFGAGIKANFSRISAQPELYDLSGNYVTGMFNLIYQAHFIPNKLVLELHAGVGVAMLFDMKFDYKTVQFASPSLNAMGLAFGGGFMLQYHPGKAKHFFVGAGADFVHAKFKDMSCGTVSPQVSFGVKF